MVKSKSVFEFRGRHEVLDAEGAVIGLLEKDFVRSLLRSHWYVRDVDGNQLLEAHEASWAIALVRRVADIFPDWLALVGWLPFNFVLNRDGQQVGSCRRVLGKLSHRYVLELEPRARRGRSPAALAFAVGLDALQDRSNEGAPRGRLDAP